MTIFNQVNSLIQEHGEIDDEIKGLVRSLRDQVKNDKITETTFNETADDYINSKTIQLRNSVEMAMNSVDTYTETELEVATDYTTTDITVDEVAELQLLGTMDVTSDDLRSYAIKYQDKRIALRKLYQIALAQGILPEAVLSAEQLQSATAKHPHEIIKTIAETLMTIIRRHTSIDSSKVAVPEIASREIIRELNVENYASQLQELENRQYWRN